MIAGVKNISLRGFVFLWAFAAAGAQAAPDEELLGKSEGYPVCRPPGAAGERCLVGTLSHMDEVFASHRVAKGERVHGLERPAKEPALRYRHDGRPDDIDGFLAHNRNTGLLVLR